MCWHQYKCYTVNLIVQEAETITLKIIYNNNLITNNNTLNDKI